MWPWRRRRPHYGFDEVQFDYVRFPTDGNVHGAVYSKDNTYDNRVAAISGLLGRASRGAAPARRQGQRRHVRLHVLGGRRPGHRPAHRGARALRRRPLADGLSVDLRARAARARIRSTATPSHTRTKSSTRAPNARCGGPRRSTRSIADPAVDPGLQGLRVRLPHLHAGRNSAADGRSARSAARAAGCSGTRRCSTRRKRLSPRSRPSCRTGSARCPSWPTGTWRPTCCARTSSGCWRRVSTRRRSQTWRKGS